MSGKPGDSAGPGQYDSHKVPGRRGRCGQCSGLEPLRGDDGRQETSAEQQPKFQQQ